MLRDALAYPLRGSNSESLYLHGLVLSFGTALALQLPGLLAALAGGPAMLLVGYLGRVYRDGLADGTEPPAYGAVGPAARRGATVVALGVAYLLPAAVVLAITGVGAANAPVTAEGLTPAATMRVFAGALAVLAVVLAATYCLPVGVGVALSTGSLRAGLDPRNLVATATSGAYFTAFWVAVFLLACALAAGGALATLGGPGAAAGVALTFHVLVGATHLVGRGQGAQGSLYDLL